LVARPALALLLTAAACTQNGTGVFLTINGPGVVTDQLSIVVDSDGQPIAHTVPAIAGALQLPTTLVAALPNRAATVVVNVAALRHAVSVAWGATPPLKVGDREIVSATVDLGPTPPDSGITILPGARFAIINQGDQLCLAAANKGTTNGTPVSQLVCATGDTSQLWQFVATDSGYYEVVNVNANLILQVEGGDGNMTNHAKVELWSGSNLLSQQWRPFPAQNGGYTFTVRHSGQCLDVPNAQPTPGLQLQQSICNGSDAQNYQLLFQP
jgi:hypothetical protein